MTSITKTLVWNEWRKQRNMVIMMAGITVMVWLCGYIMLRLHIQGIEVSQIIGATMVGLPILFGFALSDTFTGEFDKNTTPFLHGLPVTPAQIFRIKYLYSLSVFLLLSVFAIGLLSSSIDISAILTITSNELFMIECLSPVALLMLHAAIFFFAMVGRNSGGGIITIFALPLILLCSLPCLAWLLLYVPLVDKKVFLLFLLFESLILLPIFIIFGYFLWTRYISRGLSVKKSLWIAAIITIISPLLIYATVWGWTAIELKMAFQKAEKAGMALCRTQVIVPLSPDDTNITAEMQNFIENFQTAGKDHLAYRKFFVEDRRLMYFASNLANLGAGMTNEERIAGANYLLHNPETAKLNAMLEEITACKNPRLIFSPDTENIYDAEWKIFNKVQQAISFLRARGTACRIENNPEEMYKCWNTALRLVGTIEKERLYYSGWQNWKLNMAIASAIIANAVPDREFNKIAREMMFRLEKINLTTGMNDYSSPPELWQKNKAAFIDKFLSSRHTPYVLPKTDIPEWYNLLLVLAFPRTMHLLAEEMNTARTSYILSQKIRHFPMFETICREKDRNAKLDNISRSIINFYIFHNHLEINRLALALLIYRNEHGYFPKTLQQLAPAILPVIPVAAFTGKAFDYYQNGNGFTISTDDNPGSSWHINPIKFQYLIITEAAK